MTPRVFIFYFFNNTLIARHFKEGTLQEAFRLLDEMLNRGLVPNKITQDMLVNGKAKAEILLLKSRKCK